jgi:type II secretory pathway predicted ATPase ExeA
MYLKHFGLRTKPFAMNPDPAFLFASKQHAAALTMLEYALDSQAGFCLLTGEIGSGKTTVIRRILRQLSDRVRVGLISNTHRRFETIVPWALSALGLTARNDSDVAQYEALNDFLIREYAGGRRTLLIFDEAQNLSVSTLEELRLLSGVNSEADVALQVLLVGQPELRATLARPELAQLAQRVAVDFHLRALSIEEVKAYIPYRLRVAGGAEDLFESKAIEYIHYLSRGIPRLINQLCDLSLVYAYADQLPRVSGLVVVQVCKDRSIARGRCSLAEAVRPVGRLPAKTTQTVLPPPVERSFRERV